jgi:hypothetical protein
VNAAVEGIVIAAAGLLAAGAVFGAFALIANALIVHPVPPLIARAAAEPVEVQEYDDPNATIAFGTGASRVVYYGVRRHGALTSLPEAWLLRDRLPAGGSR